MHIIVYDFGFGMMLLIFIAARIHCWSAFFSAKCWRTVIAKISL